MSKIFSDEQIIKAIGVCLQHHKDCNECPLVDVDNCTILREYALDLINRLKKEIERLYNIKLDLENQLTQKGLTEYVGADVIEAETRKKTAREFAEGIIKLLWNRGRAADGKMFEYGDLTSIDVWDFAKHFGVEVQDNV